MMTIDDQEGLDSQKITFFFVNEPNSKIVLDEIISIRRRSSNPIFHFFTPDQKNIESDRRLHSHNRLVSNFIQHSRWKFKRNEKLGWNQSMV